MGLALRMVLYFAFTTLANQGFVLFDQSAGTVTFNVTNVATLLSGLIGFAGTFAAGRFFKKVGGLT